MFQVDGTPKPQPKPTAHKPAAEPVGGRKPAPATRDRLAIKGGSTAAPKPTKAQQAVIDRFTTAFAALTAARTRLDTAMTAFRAPDAKPEARAEAETALAEARPKAEALVAASRALGALPSRIADRYSSFMVQGADAAGAVREADEALQAGRLSGGAMTTAGVDDAPLKQAQKVISDAGGSLEKAIEDYGKAAPKDREAARKRALDAETKLEAAAAEYVKLWTALSADQRSQLKGLDDDVQHALAGFRGGTLALHR